MSEQIRHKFATAFACCCVIAFGACIVGCDSGVSSSPGIDDQKPNERVIEQGTNDSSGRFAVIDGDDVLITDGQKVRARISTDESGELYIDGEKAGDYAAEMLIDAVQQSADSQDLARGQESDRTSGNGSEDDRTTSGSEMHEQPELMVGEDGSITIDGKSPEEFLRDLKAELEGEDNFNEKRNALRDESHKRFYHARGLVNSADALVDAGQISMAVDHYNDAEVILSKFIQENPDSLVIDKAKLTLKHVNDRLDGLDAVDGQ